ncbi:hypothetical protein ACVWXE_001266, partial [Thermostichus sp. MS-CIW-41]
AKTVLSAVKKYRKPFETDGILARIVDWN